jgi:lysozyme
LSGGEPWTIGYGHTGGVKKGDKITNAQAEELLIKDIEKHEKELLKKLPWIVLLDDARKGVLINMAFNLGVQGLLGFKRTLKAVELGNYVDASNYMMESKWAKQVKGRAVRLSHQMLTGKWT